MTSVCRNEVIYIALTPNRFFEVAIESWPEWDLKPWPLNSIQMLYPTELSDREFNSNSEFIYTYYVLLDILITYYTYVYHTYPSIYIIM